MKKYKTENDIKKELRGILSSDDWKLRGFLLVWCILTASIIVYMVITNLFEPPLSWICNIVFIIFALPLLVMVIVGRGSRYLICIFYGILAIFSFWAGATVPDYALRNEIALAKISGLILGTYCSITALYFCFSKRVKERFICCKRKAELWRILDDLDRARKLGTCTDNEAEFDDKDDEDDIKEQLNELKEQNNELANRVDKLEKIK